MKTIPELIKALRPLTDPTGPAGDWAEDVAALIRHVETDGWIPTSLALPEKEKDVLLYCPNKYGARIGVYADNSRWFDAFGNYAGAVTHWKYIRNPKG